ncbi:hypothetical protein F4827_003121 [Paraburkholderia bannensis]|uniref:Uncharacterized protein n=1 Tax=Paraburkholderia bannensis TaxID=765414 RepID=A0A7W9TYX3_9BURK|nr:MULTISPECIES: hypothetical protein [Paraburkholderia]MBB3258253.1 hypothetical protein [Paraburkholderia sp. WP4_3_2]MBB6103266.1 hypothetical protein [Paraburkholderia bannensis]
MNHDTFACPRRSRAMPLQGNRAPRMTSGPLYHQTGNQSGKRAA